MEQRIKVIIDSLEECQKYGITTLPIPTMIIQLKELLSPESESIWKTEDDLYPEPKEEN